MDNAVLRTSLRIVELVCTLLATALIGNAIASNINAASSASAAVNFAMFTLVVSWLAGLYGLVTHYVPGALFELALLVLDFVAVLFGFIAVIVLAAKLKITNCGNIAGSDLPGDWIGFGSADDTKRCREIQGADVFMFFSLFCFMASLFFSFQNWRRSGMGGGRGAGSSIGGGSSFPGMSQVGRV